MSYLDTSSTGADYGTLTALFDSREAADRAVEQLVSTGIERGKIKQVAGSADTSDAASSSSDKGFWATLEDLFMPDEDKHSYAEGLRRGGYMVTVSHLSEAESEVALDILDDEGAVDLDEREQSWRSEGWAGLDDTTPAPAVGTFDAARSTTTASRDLADHAGDEVIPVVQETLKVGKRDVNLGRVRVRSYVVETPVSEEVALREERVTIDRRPVDRAVSATDALFQDRTIEAEEHSEEAVVSKEARVVEEIGIRKESADRVETISDSVRSTKVEVEDERTSGTSTDSFGRKPI
jgi:uncharacterized protein (TIGR02271 family)